MVGPEFLQTCNKTPWNLILAPLYHNSNVCPLFTTHTPLIAQRQYVLVLLLLGRIMPLILNVSVIVCL